MALGGSALGKAQDAVPEYMTPAAEIERRVNPRRPLKGGRIPADLRSRLGATHYAGKYSFTEEPYILEGARALQKFGMGGMKIWFGASIPSGFSFHSDWNLPKTARLAEVARHPYIQQTFAMPFSAFSLVIGPQTKGGFKRGMTYEMDAEQLEELTTYLLRTYRDRKVTFILQHWEGDWMLRGQPAGIIWKKGGPPDAGERVDAMALWLRTRQQAVSRARRSAGKTRCNVYHAAEVNRIYDSLLGIPALVSHVLPQVNLDGISWSSYDGMGTVAKVWQGLEMIEHHAARTPEGKRPFVMVGEVGRGETGRPAGDVLEWWDIAMGVFLTRKVPWIFQWELYCNEIIRRETVKPPVFDPKELKGFWLIRPNGTLGVAGRYLHALLAHAGGKLPADVGEQILRAV